MTSTTSAFMRARSDYSIGHLDADMLCAHLDESISRDRTLIVSAGYLFDPQSGREFRNEWKPFLKSKGLEYFHATEHHRRRDAGEIFYKLTQLTKDTAIRGFINLLDPAKLKFIDHSIRPYIGSAYTYSTLACMHMIGEAARELDRRVAYYIEDGNRFVGELWRFLEEIWKYVPAQREAYAFGFADRVNKKNGAEIHAADLFAWSFTRSHCLRSWVPSMGQLTEDRILRHTMQRYDPLMMSLVHSSYALRSNRTRFDF